MNIFHPGIHIICPLKPTLAYWPQVHLTFRPSSEEQQCLSHRPVTSSHSFLRQDLWSSVIPKNTDDNHMKRSCCPRCHFSVWPQGGASCTQEILCNTKTLPRVTSERADRRLVACVYNVEQEDPVCGKPSGVCYHHTEWEDTERMPQFVCGQRKR